MRLFRPFAAWSLLGALGVAAYVINLDLAPIMAQLGDGAPSSYAALRALVALQPLVLVLITVALGVGLSGKAGLTSWLTARLRGERARFPNLLLPALIGLGLGILSVLLDLAFWRLMGEPSGGGVAPSIAALLYGGITEELMLRYGLMTLLVWIGVKLVKRPLRTPGMWVAITLAAVIFGALHLPVMAQAGLLTPLVALRTIALNALLGCTAGWLYWRRGLETAMAAHMAFHPGMWLVIWLVF